jgi:hypothetical protein
MTNPKTAAASSPPNRRGSWPPLTRGARDYPPPRGRAQVDEQQGIAHLSRKLPTIDPITLAELAHFIGAPALDLTHLKHRAGVARCADIDGDASGPEVHHGQRVTHLAGVQAQCRIGKPGAQNTVSGC